MRVRPFLLVAALLAAAPPLAAQAEPWQFEGLREGVCVEFLIDSARVRDLLPGGAMPLRARDVKALHPVIASTVQERPEYAAWTPASACVYRFDAVQIGGRRQVEEEGKDIGEVVGLVVVSARLLEDGGRAADVPVELVTSNWRIRKDASLQNVDVEVAKAQITRDPRPGADNRLTIKLGDATLRWEGHPVTDSVSPVAPVERRLLIRGTDRRYRLLTWRLEPEVQRAVVGSLIVEGKGDLAKAIRNSPVRFVGPGYQRGSARMQVDVVP
jgi:hypothetical protein